MHLHYAINLKFQNMIFTPRTEPVFVNLLRSPESIPSLSGQYEYPYDNPICRPGPLVYGAQESIP
jgi:hypothetical protein